ncbi:MAG: hypothetical protein HQK65_16270 [Desulfamplus sp.]|nr:hypothetical protein [Desulfamplus sp.]
MSLNTYLARFSQALEKFEDYGFAEYIDFHQEIRPGKQAVINATVVLVNNSVLYIKEYINARYKIEIVAYAYQYQTKDGQLIFRYDNAEHKPSLSSKQHKHVSDNQVITSALPDIFDLVDEVIECL